MHDKFEQVSNNKEVMKIKWEVFGISTWPPVQGDPIH